MNPSHDGPAFACWTCLDFRHLPGIGPCPDCEPDAYTEHVLDWIDRTTRTDEGSDAA